MHGAGTGPCGGLSSRASEIIIVSSFAIETNDKWLLYIINDTCDFYDLICCQEKFIRVMVNFTAENDDKMINLAIANGRHNMNNYNWFIE